MIENLKRCAKLGHVRLESEDIELRKLVEIDTGKRKIFRCLRCGDWVEDAKIVKGDINSLPAWPRFRFAKKIYRFRYIAVERFLRGAIILFLGIELLKFQDEKSRVSNSLNNFLLALKPLSHYIGLQLDKSHIIKIIEEIFKLRSSQYNLVVILVFIYAGGQFFEGLGLWYMKRWGEYFSMIFTSIFIPLEVYELNISFSLLKISALIINLIIVFYLVMEARLFGFKGGIRAYEQDMWESSISFEIFEKFNPKYITQR